MWDPVSKEQKPVVQSLAGWLFAVPTILTVFAVTAVIGTDVVKRYIFNDPLLWSIEATELLLLVMVFCAMPYVWERRAHVHMELLQPFFPPWLKSVAALVTAVAGFSYAGLLAYQMGKQTLDMRKYGEGAEILELPFWPFALFVSFVGLVMSIQFIVHGTGALARLFGGKSSETTETSGESEGR